MDLLKIAHYDHNLSCKELNGDFIQLLVDASDCKKSNENQMILMATDISIRYIH